MSIFTPLVQERRRWLLGRRPEFWARADSRGRPQPRPTSAAAAAAATTEAAATAAAVGQEQGEVEGAEGGGGEGQLHLPGEEAAGERLRALVPRGAAEPQRAGGHPDLYGFPARHRQSLRGESFIIHTLIIRTSAVFGSVWPRFMGSGTSETISSVPSKPN